MLSQEIKNKVQLLWDRLWAGGLSNPITAIDNISYLIFMKRLEKFHPKVKDEYKWSSYNNLEGSELKSKVDNVFRFIQNDLSKEEEPFAIEMKNARFGINTPSLLEEAVRIIDEIFYLVEEEEKQHQHFQDLLGDVYEYLLRATNEAGKNGQFRTPRHIIQMMCELVAPNINNEDTKICDVTSGSSGFLVGAYQYILKENSKEIILDDENQLEKGLDGKKLTAKKKKQLTENTFYGFDIDATMVRIGMMNMMMHGIEKPHIINLNTLSAEYEDFFRKKVENEITVENLTSRKIKTEIKTTNSKEMPKAEKIFWGREEYTYILANPPFAAKVNSKSISKNLNRIYEIKEGKTQSLQTELLFLERIVYMLKKNGRAAVIIPEGVLFNSGKAYKTAREILLKDCDLEAIVSLPSGVFNPYTGVKTSILLFTKKQFGSNNYHTKKVWFYGMESDGYTLDNSRKKIKNDFPLPETVKQYKTRNEKTNPQKDRKQKHFYVPVSEIEQNGFELNYNLYKEFVFDETKYEEPTKLLKQVLKIEEELFNSLKQLEKEL
ncbi:class I SAM-dependent DNA methyltransferase [Chryseobacterium cucumeris]|uniref:class I SAM-dependent DNA methyltransferase n=1 Tax=Chryseobacterium cucumeris TaxID=1813611 RepID=UPI002457BFCE|nr:class I SAM-dependent DNA methyltransferase [Chryseobacterium cucumeris]MDH5033777.1 class I SAM-dependent DNA methyltransferase [Chryseobacterium cucumeris]